MAIPSQNMLEFNLASEKLILFSARAHQVKTLVDDFILELKKVRARPRRPTAGLPHPHPACAGQARLGGARPVCGSGWAQAVPPRPPLLQDPPRRPLGTSCRGHAAHRSGRPAPRSPRPSTRPLCGGFGGRWRGQACALLSPHTVPLLGRAALALAGDGPAALSRPLLTQDSDFVVAVRNFLPEDPALLSFHKGDIIHLQPLEPPRAGQCPGEGWARRGRWGRGLPAGLTRAPPAGYSAGCVVGKKVVYLEELRRRGPDFGGHPGTLIQLPEWGPHTEQLQCQEGSGLAAAQPPACISGCRVSLDSRVPLFVAQRSPRVAPFSAPPPRPEPVSSSVKGSEARHPHSLSLRPPYAPGEAFPLPRALPAP